MKVKNVIIIMIVVLIFGLGIGGLVVYGVTTIDDLKDEIKDVKKELKECMNSQEECNDEDTGDDEFDEVDDESNTEEDYTYDTSSFKEISPLDIKKISKGNTMVVWIGRQGCQYCSWYAPIIEQVEMPVYYIDLLSFISISDYSAVITDEKAYTYLENLTGDGKWETFAKDNLGATPLTLIIRDEKVIGGISGFTDDISYAFMDAGIE